MLVETTSSCEGEVTANIGPIVRSTYTRAVAAKERKSEESREQSKHLLYEIQRVRLPWRDVEVPDLLMTRG